MLILRRPGGDRVPAAQLRPRPWLRLAGAAAALALVAGCAGGEAEPGADLTTANPPAAPAAPDPIAAFATQAAEGEQGVVRLDGGRRVHVVVGPRYVSAARNNCRRLFLRADGGGSMVSAACETESGWRTIVVP